MDEMTRGQRLWDDVRNAFIDGFETFKARRRGNCGYYYQRVSVNVLLILHEKEQDQVASLKYEPEELAARYQYQYRGYNRRRSISFRQRRHLKSLQADVELQRFVRWTIKQLYRPVVTAEVVTFDDVTGRSGMRWLFNT